MPLKSIAAPNECGLARRGRTSQEGSRFLAYLECHLGVPIAREVYKGRYLVDGFIASVPFKLDFMKLDKIPEGSPLIIEYNGCSYHPW